MNRFLIVVIFVVCIVFDASYGSLQAQRPTLQTGVSVAEMQNFAQHLPNMQGRIQSLQIIEGQRAPLISVATFSTEKGWELSLFGLNANGRFAERWHSGKLPDTFRVSYPAALKTFNFGSEQAVQFEGCAPHSCPEVFSILLYIPSTGKEFVATNTFGKVTYSQNTVDPQNARYKQALNQLLKEH